MHGPDGRDYQNRITFEEIVPPERIVYRHGGGDDVDPVQFRTTVVASSRITAPTMAWPRRVPGLAIMWQRQLKHDLKNDTTVSQTLNSLFSQRSD